MRGRTVSMWLMGVAVACVFALAATAFAATRVNLSVDVSPKRGAYGTEVTVQPSIDGTLSVGDRVELFVLDEEDIWQKHGEGQLVEANEETGSAPVIEPIYLHLDESLSYPAVLRAAYVPRSGSPNAAAVSEPFTLRVVKNTKTAVRIKGPTSVKRSSSFTTLFEVTPNSGIGSIRLTVKKIAGAGSVSTRTVTLTTDEEGGVEHVMRFSSAGRYQISAKFLGNTFGVASPTATRTITVR